MKVPDMHERSVTLTPICCSRWSHLLLKATSWASVHRRHTGGQRKCKLASKKRLKQQSRVWIGGSLFYSTVSWALLPTVKLLCLRRSCLSALGLRSTLSHWRIFAKLLQLISRRNYPANVSALFLQGFRPLPPPKSPLKFAPTIVGIHFLLTS